MTVANKMILLVLTAVLGLIGLAWMGQNRMEAVYDKTNFTNINTVPSIVTLDDANSAFGYLRVRVYRHVLNTDAAKMAALEPKIKEAKDALEGALKKYETEGMAADDKDKQMLADDMAALKDYLPVVEDALDFSRKNKPELARDVLTQAVEKAEKLATVLKTHIDYNADIGKKAAEAAVVAKADAARMSTIVAALVVLFTALLGFFITRNLLRQLGGEPDFAAEVANKIALGDLSTNIELKTGDTTSIFAAMKNMSDALKGLLSDTDVLIRAASIGDLNTRADANKYQGDFRKLVSGVNDTVNNIAEPLKVTSSYVDQIAKGIIPAQITTDYKGEYLVIRNNLNSLIKMMGDLLSETNILIQGAAVGELDKRANAALFQGGWNQLVVGVNDTVRNIAEPMKVTSDYVDQIARGIIPAQITTDYKGEYLVIRNNLNGLVKMMGDLLGEANVLIKAGADGDLQQRANAAQFLGGWNQLVAGINNILDGIVLPVSEAVAVLTEMEKGDLTKTVNGDYKGQLGDFKDTVNNTIAKLSQVISEVNSAATNIASASEEVSSTAQSMSQATNEQAASVEQTSAAVEEMGASINQNTENAKVTEGIAANAAKDANEGGEAVSQTVEAMKQIADKISIIDDIAYQTNLLALNAAIEAARAGEHGRGFAVVAAEVRKLAERSQVAAQEIGEVAKSSVGLAEKAGHLLEEMVPNINKTSDLVQEITAASEEQSSGAGQITSAINQLNQITQQNASSSEELAATAEEMSASAEQLQGLMSFFTLNDSTAGQVRQVAPAKQSVKKAFKPAKSNVARANTDVNESEFVKF